MRRPDDPMVEAIDRVIMTGEQYLSVLINGDVRRVVEPSGRIGSPNETYLKTQGAIRAFAQRRAIRTLQKPEGDCFEIPKLPKSLQYENVKGSNDSATRIRKREAKAEALRSQS